MLVPSLLLLAPAPPLLAVDRHIVGYREAGKWRPAKYRFGTALRDLRLTRVGIGQVGGKLSAPKLVGEEVTDGVYLDLPYKTKGVYVSGLSPRVPRPVRSLGTSNPTYRAIVARYLAGQGVRVAAPRLTRIVQADLDGNGTQEVLIEARSRDNLASYGLQNSRPLNGEYSLVLLRYLRKGQVTQTPLEFSRSHPNGYLEDLRLAAVADLDRDGRMEIVTSGQGYEWTHATLWTARPTGPVKLVENGEGV